MIHCRVQELKVPARCQQRQKHSSLYQAENVKACEVKEKKVEVVIDRSLVGNPLFRSRPILLVMYQGFRPTAKSDISLLIPNCEVTAPV